MWQETQAETENMGKMSVENMNLSGYKVHRLISAQLETHLISSSQTSYKQTPIP